MKQSDLTLVLSSEAFVTMVTLRHEMQPEPVFVADDGRRNIHSCEPEFEVPNRKENKQVT